MPAESPTGHEDLVQHGAKCEPVVCDQRRLRLRDGREVVLDDFALDRLAAVIKGTSRTTRRNT